MKINMNTMINNIAKTMSVSFTACKWNDSIVFDSNVRRRLENDMEV